MLAVDIRVHEVQAKHRVSLFRLIKVEIGDLEPIYTKIPSVIDISKGPLSGKLTAQRSSGFGSVLLVADTSEILEHLHGNITVRLEIYNDHNGPLDLICAGEREIHLETCSFGAQRNLIDIPSLMLRKIAQTLNISIPIKHFTQGQYKISAGEVATSITLYRVCEDMLRNNNGDLESIMRNYDHFVEVAAVPVSDQSDKATELPPPPPPLLPHSTRIEIPELVTAEEINARLGFFTISDQKSHQEIDLKLNRSASSAADNQEVDTTREESWLDEFREDDNDYNSVDEFIEEFLATRGRSLRTHGERRCYSRNSTSSGTDRSHSPPPPPPPMQTSRSIQRSIIQPRNKNTKMNKGISEKKLIKKQSSSSHQPPTPSGPLKPKRVSPRLIGAAADRGRWLFARVSDI